MQLFCIGQDKINSMLETALDACSYCVNTGLDGVDTLVIFKGQLLQLHHQTLEE